MDSNASDFSTTSAPSVGTEFEEKSGHSLSTDQESIQNGNGMESSPHSVDPTKIRQQGVVNHILENLPSSVKGHEVPINEAPPTVEVRHGKQGINVRLTPQVNTALFNLIALGIHRPTLHTLLDMMNLGKNRFKKNWEQSHCALCHCEVPKGKAGRTCKPCRGIPYSESEKSDPNVMRSFVHHIGYAQVVAKDVRQQMKNGATLEQLAQSFKVPLQHLDFILKEIPDEPETNATESGTGDSPACEAGCVGPDAVGQGSDDTNRSTDFSLNEGSVQHSNG